MAMNGRRVTGAASIGLGSLIAVIAACGPGDLGGLTSGLRQGQTIDGGQSTKADAGLSCVLAGPPPKPESASNAGGQDSELIFAIDDLRIDGSTANTTASLPVPVGIDLDGTCTNTCDNGVGAPATCKPFGGGHTPCDGDGGTDNVTAPLLGQLTSFVQVLDPVILKQRIADGFFSLIIDMIQWNGNADDPNVIVSLRMSTGTDDGSGNRVPAQFNGNDTWNIDPTSITDANTMLASGERCSNSKCIAGAIDLNAYVANHKLVAHIPKLKFAFNVTGNGQLSIPYIGLTLIADLTTDSNGVITKVSGELSGRWPADDILSAAGAFGSASGPNAGAATALCTNEETYQGFKAAVCQAADLATAPADDSHGTTCGALSESMRFTASPALLGFVRQNSSTILPCGSHTGDTCAAH